MNTQRMTLLLLLSMSMVIVHCEAFGLNLCTPCNWPKPLPMALFCCKNLHICCGPQSLPLPPSLPLPVLPSPLLQSQPSLGTQSKSVLPTIDLTSVINKLFKKFVKLTEGQGMKSKENPVASFITSLKLPQTQKNQTSKPGQQTISLAFGKFPQLPKPFPGLGVRPGALSKAFNRTNLFPHFMGPMFGLLPMGSQKGLPQLQEKSTKSAIRQVSSSTSTTSGPSTEVGSDSRPSRVSSANSPEATTSQDTSVEVPTEVSVVSPTNTDEVKAPQPNLEESQVEPTVD